MADVDVKKKLHVELGFSREIGLRWIQASRDGNMRDLRDLVDIMSSQGGSSLFRLLHYDGHGTTAGFVGNTALHWACSNGDTTMVNYLLDKGTAVNSQNNGLSTPLHTSSSNNHPHIVNLLLRAGASPFIIDCCGDTAAQVLPVDAARGMKEMLETSELIAEGADVESWSVRDVERIASIFGLHGSGSDLRLKCATIVRMAISAQKAASLKGDEAMTFLKKIRRQRHVVDDEDRPQLEEAAQRFRELGNELFVSGDHKGAIRMFTSGINLLPDAKLLCNRAASYLALGLFQNAAQDSEMALSKDPLWVKPYFRLGCSLRALGRYQEAQRVLEKALTLESIGPSDAESIALQLAQLKVEAQSSHVSPAPIQGKRPWFDCTVCENKTRDRGLLDCCDTPVCNTCIRRSGGCPVCK